MLARILADRWLRPGPVRFFAATILAGVLILALFLYGSQSVGTKPINAPQGFDFGQFYLAGRVLNEGKPGQLYDLDVQNTRLHQLLPGLDPSERLPFVYPPVVAIIFQPLARLAFSRSLAAWTAISVLLYLVAVGLTLRTCPAIHGSDRTTAWLLAASFTPFTMECCLGGQISAIGCFAVSASWALWNSRRLWLTGLFLSILLYKPTLLILILPMLVVNRAWRVVGGFCVGTAILGLVSWLAVGTSGCRQFGLLMLGYGESGGSVMPGFKTIKYVDLVAFLNLLGLPRSYCRPLAGVIGLPVLLGLVTAWRRCPPGRISDLAWASTLCLIPVLNLYGPVYDVSLVVPGLLIGVNAVRAESPASWPLGLRWLLASVCLSALVSQGIASKIGFQPLTLCLLAMGSYFLARELKQPPTVET